MAREVSPERYAQDCTDGTIRAEEVVIAALDAGASYPLVWAIERMVRAGKWSGEEVGFVSRLGEILLTYCNHADHGDGVARATEHDCRNGAAARIVDKNPRRQCLTEK